MLSPNSRVASREWTRSLASLPKFSDRNCSNCQSEFFMKHKKDRNCGLMTKRKWEKDGERARQNLYWIWKVWFAAHVSFTSISVSTKETSSITTNLFTYSTSQKVNLTLQEVICTLWYTTTSEILCGLTTQTANHHATLNTQKEENVSASMRTQKNIDLTQIWRQSETLS